MKGGNHMALTMKEKGLILDEFTSLTSYTRCYASFILRNWGRKIRLRMEGKELVVVLGGVELPRFC
jgi:hypothetical protein